MKQILVSSIIIFFIIIYLCFKDNKIVDYFSNIVGSISYEGYNLDDGLLMGLFEDIGGGESGQKSIKAYKRTIIKGVSGIGATSKTSDISFKPEDIKNIFGNDNGLIKIENGKEVVNHAGLIPIFFEILKRQYNDLTDTNKKIIDLKSKIYELESNITKMRIDIRKSK